MDEWTLILKTRNEYACRHVPNNCSLHSRNQKHRSTCCLVDMLIGSVNIDAMIHQIIGSRVFDAVASVRPHRTPFIIRNSARCALNRLTSRTHLIHALVPVVCQLCSLSLSAAWISSVLSCGWPHKWHVFAFGRIPIFDCNNSCK